MLGLSAEYGSLRDVRGPNSREVRPERVSSDMQGKKPIPRRQMGERQRRERLREGKERPPLGENISSSSQSLEDSGQREPTGLSKKTVSFRYKGIRAIKSVVAARRTTQRAKTSPGIPS